MVADNSAEYLISLSRYVDDPEFIKAILPLMRRDWPLLKNYRFRHLAPLSCPITAFAARQDDVVYTDEVQAWSRHTEAGFELIEVDGDHWFLNRNRERIGAVLAAIALQPRFQGRSFSRGHGCQARNSDNSCRTTAQRQPRPAVLAIPAALAAAWDDCEILTPQARVAASRLSISPLKAGGPVR